MRPAIFYYDGDCGFCAAAVGVLRRLDWFRRVRWADFRVAAALPARAPAARLADEACLDDGGARPQWGFYAFRGLTLRLPALWPLAPLFWLPGFGRIGQPAYRWVARNRYRISRCCRTGPRGGTSGKSKIG